MMHTLIQFFWLGFVITAIPGTVFFETIRRSLSQKSSIMKFMAGNFSGMFMIIISSIFGLSAILSGSSLKHLFYALSGAVLLYIGISSLFITHHETPHTVANKANNRNFDAFLTGFTLAAANPISIIFWISMTGNMIQQKMSPPVVISNCISIVLGASLVFALLIGFVSISKTKIKSGQLLILSRVFGLIIMVYGVITFGKAL